MLWSVPPIVVVGPSLGLGVGPSLTVAVGLVVIDHHSNNSAEIPSYGLWVDYGTVALPYVVVVPVVLLIPPPSFSFLPG